MSIKAGLVAEEQARNYLVTQGLQWIESNYRCPWGEIDLIMRENNYLVFVEVKARVSQSHGGAAASVTFSKQQKLIKTATNYLQSKKLYDKHPTRFDVLGFDGKGKKVEWIKNAFGLNF
ncbi:MAG: YraN family protein [Tatlockia sp.]|nr:YraN family protein [Tatlockia sp.]